MSLQWTDEYQILYFNPGDFFFFLFSHISLVGSVINCSTLLIYIAVFSVFIPQFSRSVVSDSLRPHESQHTRPPCPSPAPGVHSNLCPSSRWCHPAIQSSHPILLLPSIPPSISLFQWVNSSHEVVKVLEFQLQHQSFQWTPRTDLL